VSQLLQHRTARREENMVDSIPVDLLEKWLQDLRSILKADARKTKNNLLIDEGMLHGLDQVQHRITTWLEHKVNRQRLRRSRKKILVTKRVTLSRGRYRKLQWYEEDHFLTLAWRHAKGALAGELTLEMQHVQELSTVYLVYLGDLSFDELADQARKGGLSSIRNEQTLRQWKDETLT
jgi:hypothetical protein